MRPEFIDRRGSVKPALMTLGYSYTRGASVVRESCGYIARYRRTDTGQDRSRPLCAYPKHAQYLGRGDIEDAWNFGCQ